MATSQRKRPLVFISHSDHSDDSLAYELAEALNATCDAWVDKHKIDPDDDIYESVKAALSEATLIVGLVSDTFMESRPCRFEMTTGVVRSITDRVRRYQLVYEGTFPSGLGNTLSQHHAIRWSDAVTVAERIAAVAVALEGAERRENVPSVPAFGLREDRLGGFVGRLDATLAIYDKVVPHAALATGANSFRRLYGLNGGPGMGKTAIAQRFAEDLSPAFGGGVVWIDAGGDAIYNVADGALDLESVYLQVGDRIGRWIDQVSARQGSQFTAFKPVGINARARLEYAATRAIGVMEEVQKRGPVLWIVDDLPAGLGPNDLGLITAPKVGNSLTLITSRQSLDVSGIDSYPVDSLSEDEGLHLLKTARKEPPWSEKRIAELRTVVQLVGGHPLALDVLRDHLAQGYQPSDIIADLETAEGISELIGAELAEALPTDHSANVVASLRLAMAQVARTSPEATSVFRLLALTPPGRLVYAGLIEAVMVEHHTRSARMKTIGRLVNASLAHNVHETADGRDDGGISVHAITRLVSRYLLRQGQLPLTPDPDLDRTIAWRAAAWFHAQGDGCRNSDDIGAVPWFERTLETIEMMASTGEMSREERVLRSACHRGIARPVYRGLRAEAGTGRDQTCDDAMARVHLASDIARGGLADFPDDPYLLLEYARAQALWGDLQGTEAERLANSGNVPGGLELIDEALVRIRGQIDIRVGLAARTRHESGPTPVLLGSSGMEVDALDHAAKIDAERAKFNLPGRLVVRAKLLAMLANDPFQDPQSLRRQGLDALDEARLFYSAVETRRMALFAPSLDHAQREESGFTDHSQPSSTYTSEILEISAGGYGLALSDYYEALLFRSGYGERVQLLESAKGHLHRATRLRGIGRNEGDLAKCAQLALKVGLARAHLDGDTDYVDTTAIGEHLAALLAGVPKAEVKGIPAHHLVSRSTQDLLELAHSQPADATSLKDRRDASVVALLHELGNPEQRDSRVIDAALTTLAIQAASGSIGAGAVAVTVQDWANEVHQWVAPPLAVEEGGTRCG